MAIVTLTTDFGTADSYVAEMKGVLLSRAPSSVLVDVSHQIAPGNVPMGAYLVGRTWHRFPAGTIHLAVVDPGVGTVRRGLAIAAHGHHFVGPDNGVFTAVLRDAEVEIVVLPTPSGASATFHGRDVFAPAAAALADGAQLSSLGSAFAGIPARLASNEPHLEGSSLVGEIVYVDHFGNLITNLAAERVTSHAHLTVEDLDLGELKRTYGDVASGTLVAYAGSAGLVEIAVRDGSAAKQLSLGIGTPVRVYLE
jgi:S-adenosylmethionine hydrolase